MCVYKCFTREFSGQSAQRNIPDEAQEFQLAVGQSLSQSQPSSGKKLQQLSFKPLTLNGLLGEHKAHQTEGSDEMIILDEH